MLTKKVLQLIKPESYTSAITIKCSESFTRWLVRPLCPPPFTPFTPLGPHATLGAFSSLGSHWNLNLTQEPLPPWPPCPSFTLTPFAPLSPLPPGASGSLESLQQPWEPLEPQSDSGTFVPSPLLCPLASLLPCPFTPLPLHSPLPLHFRLGFRIPTTCDAKKVQ